ncbi:AMP-binding protein [Persicimonas caeni]|nr:AMP-binding protein [Persicimonas caeni]
MNDSSSTDHKPNGHAPAGVNGANGSTVVEPTVEWSVSETLSGRTILLTGATGFLGKAFLSMLLRYHPDIDQVYVLIRPRATQTAEERFFQQIAANSVMDPLREIYEDGYIDFIKEKCTPLAGDITDAHLGLDEDEARAISSNLDVLINSAGLTNFNPNLESALTINTLSQRNLLDFVRLGGNHASYMHVSTCFVAGNVDGKVEEQLPGPTRYPNYTELGVSYDAEREIEDCLAMIAHAKQLASDQEHQSQFAKQARDKLKKKNLDPNNPVLVEQTLAKLRSDWLRKRLSHEGRERADFWGWPNIYTYTKSLGERVLAAAKDEINLTIFRPAIIESAMQYPSVGWNEGINTSAPLVFLMSKGHRYVPTRRGVNLDVVPVDYVAGGMLAAAAALIDKRQHDVYHCGSGHLNPVSVERLVELTNLGLRKLYRNKRMPTWQKLLLNSLDSVPVSAEKFDRQSAPQLKRAAKGLRGLLDKVPTKQLGGLGKAVNAVKSGLKAAETVTGVTEKIFELMVPFTHHNAFTFLTDNLPELASTLPASEQKRYGSPVEDIDWRHYWLDVHVPGLYRHAFPELEAKFKASGKKSYTYDDLIELFDASTHNFSKRVALQHHSNGITERYTYGELKEHAERAADMLVACGVTDHASALIVSENRPQWGMTYFGILKAGGVAVPVDPDSSAAQIANLMRSCQARAAILSDAAHERLGAELQEMLREEGTPAVLLTFGQLFNRALPSSTDEVVELGELAADGGRVAHAAPGELVAAADEGQPLASLIYTSGTTGTPKGVMLTHQNFTNLLASLQQTFSINERDGFLSVLPLHHTFEFACGFLMPLSKGATITYLDELSGEELNSALSSTRVTALIGVPALWQLLNRRIKQRIDDAPPAVAWALDFLLGVNTTLRDRFNVNIGPTVFGAVHKAFGGRLKYLISGGAALPADVLEAFHGLGFNLYEGYGLTEAAPVLTVNAPDDGLNPGSVGKPLPGIEVKIHEPNDEGVGEVIARGPNVMRGYLDREEETERALQDGWLHTGDLGKMDKRGRLTIVGREKEVIVTSGGKNVYPDELEEVYGACDDIEELSIVGLPDGSGSERVACLVRPSVDEGASAEQVAEARSRIREHFRVEGSRMASHNRIKVLRFWDQEFPRTATRKIKRTDVVDILERLHERELAEMEVDEEEEAEWAWLYGQIARLADVDAEDVHGASHFVDDLGFDSLMVVELASILAERDFHVSTEQLSGVHTVRQLERLLDAEDSELAHAMVHAKKPTHERVDEFPVHPALAEFGKKMLHLGQKKAYDEFFDVEIYGRANIPHHDPNVIVAANHSSHLDMGLVKYALGDYGKDVRALAAADYFFSNPARKTYFNNFTNLIPVARSGSLEGALAGAEEALSKGEMVLVFPEGTRSKDGKLQEFRRGVGYLAASRRVNILPLYIDGTHRALPKGSSLPSVTSRKLKVYIGPMLDVRSLLRDCEEMSPMEQYEYISKKTREAIVKLRDAAHARPGRDDEDLSPLFTGLNDKFERNKLTEEVSFYFSLGSNENLKWTIIVNPEDCQIRCGKPQDGRADCVIKTSPDIFKKIVTESYVPSMDEFMSGKIKTNDPQLLMQFQNVFAL